MAGQDVNKYVIDSKCADAVLSLRSAFDKVETLAKWLANNPNGVDTDPLVDQYGYTADEAYLIRVTFESFDAIRAANVTAFDTARRLTGLE